MTTSSVEEVRRRWIEEKPVYERLGQKVTSLLMTALRGVKPRITHRTKTVASLVKKFVRKQYADYDQISDKIGVRVVVALKSQLEVVDKAIYEQCDVHHKEDKAGALGPDTLGYLSVHYDVTLKSSDELDTELAGKKCEIQVRTLCQDVWAEMAHNTIYKPTLTEIPHQIARRVNILSGLLEVCDWEFESMNEELTNFPGATTASILRTLEEGFHQFSAATFDTALTTEVIDLLLPLIGDVASFQARFDEWVTLKSPTLERVFDLYKGEEDRWVFLFQPESLMLLYLLEKDRFALAERWTEKFPFDELQGVATAFGLPYDMH